MTTATRFVTGGGMRIDYLIAHDGQAHLELPGGNALYAAVGAALWSKHVAPWARVGENYPAELLSQLEMHTLDTSGLKRISGDHDHRTFYAYTADGRRDDTNPVFHFARIGVSMPKALTGYLHSTPGQAELSQFDPLALRIEDWPGSFDAVGALHLAPLPIRSHKEIVRRMGERGMRIVTLDPGERYMVPDLAPTVREILPHVSAFLPSESEVRSLLGPAVTMQAAVKTLGAWGAPLVVVKRGKKGVLLHDRESDETWRQPPYHPEGNEAVVDVTGAGDAFCGGFMVGLAKTGSARIAARMGAVSASLVIEGYGALYALDKPQALAGERLRYLDSARPEP
jgi:sugar/nucleoside kinase (ribokinase family)